MGRQSFATSLLLAMAIHQSNAQSIDPSEHQQFADELTSSLYSKPNECSSALGISMVFSLIYPGCTNDAIDEVQTTLRYPEDEEFGEPNNMQLVWEETTARMLAAASGECPENAISSWDGSCYSEPPTLKIANSIWYDSNQTLNEDYDKVVGKYAIQTDFTLPTSPLVVNEWVDNSTNGMISEIVDPNQPLFPPDLLVAINSIYLKARWQEQFSEHATNLDIFYSSASRDEKVSDAHFMHNVEDFDYSHETLLGNYQVIDLKFMDSGGLSMIFVLPMMDDMDVVSSTDLITVLEGNELQSTRVALSLPKFKFESEYKDGLKEALVDLGIVAPFTEGAQGLCGIFEEEDFCDMLVITKIIQKTVIDVNEKGVEAAAVSAIGVGMTSAAPPPPDPILMVLDHPFQFFIYDKTEGLMLFEGRVGAPEVPEAEPAKPLLQGRHEDEEFWSKLFFADPIVPESSALLATTSAATTVVATTQDATTTSSSAMVEGIVPSDQPSIDPSKHQEFADDLTAMIYTNDNECSSALGVSMAFSLIYPGCVGDSIEQVRDTLYYPKGTNMQLVWEVTTQSMLDSSDGKGSKGSEAPLLEIANSVWFDEGDTLNEDYEEVVGDYAMQTDFKDDKSPFVVNEWVEESTNGSIKSIVPTDQPLFPPYALIAINSIYLKARWLNQFSESKTNLDSFYTSASRSTEATQAHFMNIVEHFGYSDAVLPGYQVIDLPFASSQLSMVFVLPMMSGNGEAVAADTVAVPSTQVISVLDGLEHTNIALSLPKFKFESMYDSLADSLYDLGIEDPFIEGTGALCGLFEDSKDCDKLVVDKVIQKTVIDLNEKGVEAAAVTAVFASVTSVGLPPPPPTLMILDHPFQFFIYDKAQDLMLFEGRVGSPEVPEKEPDVSLLDAKHEDPDFWLDAFFVNPIVPAFVLDATTTDATMATTEDTTTVATTTPPQQTSTIEASPAPSTSEATTVSQSTAAATTTAATTSSSATTTAAESTSTYATTTSVNPTADVTSTSSTTSSSMPEPEPIVQPSSGNARSKGFAAMCTSILFFWAYIL